MIYGENVFFSKSPPLSISLSWTNSIKVQLHSPNGVVLSRPPFIENHERIEIFKLIVGEGVGEGKSFF